MSRLSTGGAVSGFRAFRRSRPFWAGVFTAVAGAEIMIFPLTPISSLVNLGVAGISSMLTGIVLILLGAFMWFSPPNRTLSGMLAILFSLAAFITSNLGGLVVGMVLGLIGGGLCLAWTPTGKPPRRRRGGKGGGDAEATDVIGESTEIIGPDDPGPRRSGGGHRAQLRLRAGVVAVATIVLTGVAAPGTASAEEQCVLGLFCSPSSDSSPSSGSPQPTKEAPAPSSSSKASSPAPSSAAPTSSAPPPGGLGSLLAGPAGALTDAASGLPLSQLPPLGPSLVPGLGDALPALVTPAQPTVAGGDVVVSDRIGKLTMDSLSATNFRYVGIVEHRSATGRTVKAMRLQLDSTDIGNLGVVMPGEKASILVNQAAGAPHASTVPITLDVTRLKITLYGVLPVEFSFAFPPPPLITIPVLTGTDVDIDFVDLSSSLMGPKVLITVGPGGTGPSSDGTKAAPATDATLVSIAKLLKLPKLLTPYGLSDAQAQRAVAGEQPGAAPAAGAPGSPLAALAPAPQAGSSATPAPSSAPASGAPTTPAPSPAVEGAPDGAPQDATPTDPNG